MPLLGIHPNRSKSTSEGSTRTYVQNCLLQRGSEWQKGGNQVNARQRGRAEYTVEHLHSRVLELLHVVSTKYSLVIRKQGPYNY